MSFHKYMHERTVVCSCQGGLKKQTMIHATTSINPLGIKVTGKTKHYFTLARLLSWLKHRPVNKKVAGSIPGLGTYRR